MKKLIKIFVIFLVFIMVMLIATPFIINALYSKEDIKKIVAPEVTKLVKRDIDLKDVNFSIYPILGFTIEGVSITNTLRTLTIQEDLNLDQLLAGQQLDKSSVIVEINGTKFNEIATLNKVLKKGDIIRISRKEFSKGSLFSIDKIQVETELIPLFSKKVVIKNIILDKMKIVVEADKKGSFNFDDIIPKSDGKTKEEPSKKEENKELPVKLTLKSFQIKDAEIIYKNMKEKQEIILTDINQTVSVNADKKMEKIVTKGLFEIKSITVKGEGIPVNKSGMTFSLSHNLKIDLLNGNIDISEIKTGFQQTSISLKGAIKNFDKPVKNLDLKVKSNNISIAGIVADIPTALAPEVRKIKAKGNLSFALNVKGNIDETKPEKQPAVNGSIKIKEVYVKHADFPESLNSFNAQIGFTNNSLKIPYLSLKLGSNPISLKALIDNFKSPSIDVDLKSSLNLSVLKKITALPKGTAVSGTIQTDIAAKGKVDPNNPAAIKVNGSVNFKNVNVKTAELKTKANINGSLILNNEMIKIKDFVTKFNKSSVKFNMTVSNYLSQLLPQKQNDKPVMVNYKMTSPLLDINEIIHIKKGKELKNQEQDSDDPIIIPELPNVIVNGNINFKKILYLTIPVKNASVKLLYKNRVLSLNSGAHLYSGKISEELTLNFKNKNIIINNKFSSIKMEANDFISNFNDLLDDDGAINSKIKDLDNTVYGKINLTTSARTSGIKPSQFKKNLDADLMVKIYNGKIVNAKIIKGLTSDLPSIIKDVAPDLSTLKSKKPIITKLKVKNEKIIIEEFKASPQGHVVLSKGTVGFNTSVDMNSEIILSKKISKKITSNQRKLKKGVGSYANKLAKGNKYAKTLTNKALSKATLIPVNNNGLVVVGIKIGGTVSNPKFSFDGFKGNNAPKGSGGKDKSGNIKKDIEKELNKIKASTTRKVRKKISEVKKNADKAFKMKKQSLKKDLKQHEKKADKYIKKKTKNKTIKKTKKVKKKAKNMFKKLGF